MTDTNSAFAEIFRSMAELLAVRGANPHRIRAYRRAAEALVNLHEDVALVAQREELRKIPGIGRDLSARIREYLTTGKIRSYEVLKIPLPPEVAEWPVLLGLSEAVVRHLSVRLNIRSLADLEALVRSHLLRTLPGVTVVEEDLLAAIQERKQTEPLP